MGSHIVCSVKGRRRRCCEEFAAPMPSQPQPVNILQGQKHISSGTTQDNFGGALEPAEDGIGNGREFWVR